MYIKSTAEILAFKVLNRQIDKIWIEWAVDMLMTGYETEHLIILAGENEPFNQFYMQKLTNKVFEELNLDYTDTEIIIKEYASYLINKSFDNEISCFDVLTTLKDLCIELDYERYLYDFYSLYFAKEDLLYTELQYYWDGATRENIEQIIIDYFKKWKSSYPVN